MEKRKINMTEFMYELRGWGFPFWDTQNFLVGVGETFYFRDDTGMKKYRVTEWKLIDDKSKYKDEDCDIVVICIEINSDDDIEKMLKRDYKINQILEP